VAFGVLVMIRPVGRIHGRQAGFGVLWACVPLRRFIRVEVGFASVCEDLRRQGVKTRGWAWIWPPMRDSTSVLLWGWV
jgi:hypothetical protein